MRQVWWRCLFCWVVDLSLVNTFVCYSDDFNRSPKAERVLRNQRLDRRQVIKKVRNKIMESSTERVSGGSSGVKRTRHDNRGTRNGEPNCLRWAKAEVLPHVEHAFVQVVLQGFGPERGFPHIVLLLRMQYPPMHKKGRTAMSGDTRHVPSKPRIFF